MEIKQTPLAAVWSQVTSLIEAGYSLIPVRDKEEAGRPAKSPYPYWKKYQSQIISAGELWTQMEKFNTSAIAVICGKVSGNLEVIDIDVKWKPGVEAKLFSDIKLLYPELWERLRLHRSPSGGFHIPYKIIDQTPPGSQKLSSRNATLEDMVKSKTVSFIETKGEGGYVLVPPSLGYSIYKSQPTPLLTWNERCALIALCQAYNEVIKIEQPPRGNRFEDEYYEENPFDHFNKSEQGADVLQELGWKRNGDNNTFSWFTKPGSGSKERHASYIKERKLFFFWTTNTEFEPQKCYTASSVLALISYSSDYKLLYKELVRRGFGKIKKYKEEKIIKLGRGKPENLSLESKQLFDETIKERSELHPAGVFWQLNEDGTKAAIDREGLYRVASYLGFRLYLGFIYRLKGKFLRKVEEREFQDIVKAYIREKDPDLFLLIVNTYEHFLQIAGKFTMTRLQELRDEELLLDTRTEAYKFYQDCYIKITKTGVTKFDYSGLDKLVMENKYLNRPLVLREEPSGCFIDFLIKSVEYDIRKDYVEKVLGYLAHDYKNASIGYIILLSEQCENPKMGGGSGKNLFCDLLSNIITKTTKAGSQAKYDEKFLQTWNGERIFVISDAPKNFDFLFLKELSTGSGIWKKLFKDEVTIEPGKMPKFVIQTNYSYNDVDGGIKRRIIPLEFTDFFTRSHGVDAYYGKYFPDDWSEDDWAGYDYTMIMSIRNWLAGDLKIDSVALTTTGWRKQFQQKYPNMIEFVESYLEIWFKGFIVEGEVDNETFNRHQQEFKKENNIHDLHWPGVRRINEALKEYFEYHEWGYEYNVPRGMYKTRVFTREKVPF